MKLSGSNYPLSMNNIRESLRKICGLLNKHEVEYILIGGVAVGFHGFPRATADIDFWYHPTNENFVKIIKALTDFGINTSSLKELVFDPERTFLRIPQLSFRTEFLPKIPGIESFTQAKKSALRTQLDGVEVYVLGYDDLIKNKETLNRKIDQIDVEELKKRNKK
jgi:predicted nucleotidyltransferase